MQYKIIVFKGVYDTLDIMADHLAQGFRNLGYDVMIFDARCDMAENLQRLAGFLSDKVLAAVSFNNLGMNLEIEEGKNFWDQSGIYFIDILVDHPLHYHDSLVKAPEKAIILCIDENHAAYVKRFYPNILLADFLAHGGTQIEAQDKPWEGRTIDVLYVGGLSSGQVSPKVFNNDRYPDIPLSRIWNLAYNLIICDPDLLVETALEKALLAEGIRLEDSRLRELISDFEVLDYYAVSYYREQVVKALVQAGISVALYGSGWDSCEWVKAPNCHYMGRVPVLEVLEEMYDAKIVLNTMTWFKKGSHERIMNGMLAGALVVSDESAYLSENYEIGQELYTFSLREINRLPDLIRGILADHRSPEIAARGRQRALTRERWEDRAAEIDRCLLASLKDPDEDSSSEAEASPCCGCGACEAVCPTKALHMVQDDLGFSFPQVDEDLCIQCDRCDAVCQQLAQRPVGKSDSYRYYAARNISPERRMESQSGGVFATLAKAFLTHFADASVYGVAFDGEKAHYLRVRSLTELPALYGSKYTATQTDRLYDLLREDLQAHRPVLFSGSPCVLEGVSRYIALEGLPDKDFYGIDLICHGTPAPIIAEKYLQLLSEYGKIEDFRFRDKTRVGWHGNEESFLIDGCRKYGTLYSRIFSENLGYRDSCYQCHYASIYRNSDLTIGDCWGSEGKLPDWEDETGISLIIARSDKADFLLSLTESELLKRPIAIEEYLQPNLSHPTARPEANDAFWSDFMTEPANRWLSKYGQESLNSILDACILSRMVDNSQKGLYPSDYLVRKGIRKVIICGDSQANSILQKDLAGKGIPSLAFITHSGEPSESAEGIPIVPLDLLRELPLDLPDAYLITEEAYVAAYMDALLDAGIPAQKLLPLSFIARHDL